MKEQAKREEENPRKYDAMRRENFKKGDVH